LVKFSLCRGVIPFTLTIEKEERKDETENIGSSYSDGLDPGGIGFHGPK
jgi:hypothetical protein